MQTVDVQCLKAHGEGFLCIARPHVTSAKMGVAVAYVYRVLGLQIYRESLLAILLRLGKVVGVEGIVGGIEQRVGTCQTRRLEHLS